MFLQAVDEIFPAAQSLAAFAAPQSLLNRLVAVLYALGSMHEYVLTVIMAEVRECVFGFLFSSHFFIASLMYRYFVRSILLTAGTIAHKTRVAVVIVCRPRYPACATEADSTRPRDVSGTRCVDGAQMRRRMVGWFVWSRAGGEFL